MAADLKIVEFPAAHIEDIPGGLRRLADGIEAGEYGAAHALVWVVDCGGKLKLGLLGQSAEAGAVAHLLLAMGMRKLELQ